MGDSACMSRESLEAFCLSRVSEYARMLYPLVTETRPHAKL